MKMTWSNGNPNHSSVIERREETRYRMIFWQKSKGDIWINNINKCKECEWEMYKNTNKAFRMTIKTVWLCDLAMNLMNQKGGQTIKVLLQIQRRMKNQTVINSNISYWMPIHHKKTSIEQPVIRIYRLLLYRLIMTRTPPMLANFLHSLPRKLSHLGKKYWISSRKTIAICNLYYLKRLNHLTMAYLIYKCESFSIKTNMNMEMNIKLKWDWSIQKYVRIFKY